MGDLVTRLGPPGPLKRSHTGPKGQGDCGRWWVLNLGAGGDQPLSCRAEESEGSTSFGNEVGGAEWTAQYSLN